MARDQVVVDCPAGQWTELTDGGGTASSVSFQIINGVHCYLRVTATASAPATTARGVLYLGGQGEKNVSLSTLFSAGGSYLWAMPVGGQPAAVWVDHA